MKKFLILPVLLLAACSGPDNGEVMNSRYNPAWVQIIPPTQPFIFPTIVPLLS